MGEAYVYHPAHVTKHIPEACLHSLDPGKGKITHVPPDI